jgi:hypothetical protein
MNIELLFISLGKFNIGVVVWSCFSEAIYCVSGLITFLIGIGGGAVFSNLDKP